MRFTISILLLAVVGITTAGPVPKKIVKKSINPSQEAKPTSTNSELKVTNESSDVKTADRTKKQATTFCVNIQSTPSGPCLTPNGQPCPPCAPGGNNIPPSGGSVGIPGVSSGTPQSPSIPPFSVYTPPASPAGANFPVQPPVFPNPSPSFPSPSPTFPSQSPSFPIQSPSFPSQTPSFPNLPSSFPNPSEVPGAGTALPTTASPPLIFTAPPSIIPPAQPQAPVNVIPAPGQIPTHVAPAVPDNSFIEYKVPIYVPRPKTEPCNPRIVPLPYPVYPKVNCEYTFPNGIPSADGLPVPESPLNPSPVPQAPGVSPFPSHESPNTVSGLIPVPSTVPCQPSASVPSASVPSSAAAYSVLTTYQAPAQPQPVIPANLQPQIVPSANLQPQTVLSPSLQPQVVQGTFNNLAPSAPLESQSMGPESTQKCWCEFHEATRAFHAAHHAAQNNAVSNPRMGTVYNIVNPAQVGTQFRMGEVPQQQPQVIQIPSNFQEPIYNFAVPQQVNAQPSPQQIYDLPQVRAGPVLVDCDQQGPFQLGARIARDSEGDANAHAIENDILNEAEKSNGNNQSYLTKRSSPKDQEAVDQNKHEATKPKL